VTDGVYILFHFNIELLSQRYVLYQDLISLLSLNNPHLVYGDYFLHF